ncbi:hypothetical protein SBV1_gp50 [Sulfolobales Beppu virus 1]|nr:hypothetical protein SBV1_gp50 [Sulfolobales Beppu virus 1]
MAVVSNMTVGIPVGKIYDLLKVISKYAIPYIIGRRSDVIPEYPLPINMGKHIISLDFDTGIPSITNNAVSVDARHILITAFIDLKKTNDFQKSMGEILGLNFDTTNINNRIHYLAHRFIIRLDYNIPAQMINVYYHTSFYFYKNLPYVTFVKQIFRYKTYYGKNNQPILRILDMVVKFADGYPDRTGSSFIPIKYDKQINKTKFSIIEGTEYRRNDLCIADYVSRQINPKNPDTGLAQYGTIYYECDA